MSETPIAPSGPAPRPLELAPVRPLSIAVVAGLGLVLITSLIGVVTDWTTAAAKQRAAVTAGTGSTDFFRDQIDTFSTAVTWILVFLAAAVVMSVVFIVWMSRARANAELISARPHRLSRGMATGGWFIPIANLWISRIALEDVWMASAPSAEERQPRLVRAWWAVMLSSLAVYIVGSIANPRPVVTLSGGSIVDGLDSLAAAAQYVAWMNTVLLILLAVEAALTCTIVLRITEWQTTGTVRAAAIAAVLPAGAVTTISPAGVPVHVPPVRSTGTTAVAFAWVWTLLFGCAAIALGSAISALGTRAMPTYEISTVVFAGAVLLGLIMLMPAGAVFASWLQRAQTNASTLSAAAPPVSPAWAVLGCFVPIANFFIPAQVMAFVARVSGVGSGLVGAWWVAWIGAWITFWSGFPLPGRSINKALLPLWPSAVLFAVSAVLLTVLVGAVGRYQERSTGG